MIATVCTASHVHWWEQFLHPGQLRTCGGYWFYSGIGSDFSEVTLLAAVLGLYRHKNCHVKGCWRLGHADPAHGHPACVRHSSRRSAVGVDPHKETP